MRSSALVRLLTSTSSCFTVPCSTLKTFTCPTYGSTIVLNTIAAASGPSLAVGAGRFLDEELREPVDADRAWSRCRTAPGNTVPLAIPSASASRELRGIDLLVVEVALHQVVVADRRFPRRARRGSRALRSPSRRGSSPRFPARRTVGVRDRGVVEQVDDAARARLPRRSGAAAARRPRRSSSFNWSSVRENDARSRSSLLTKMARGMPTFFGELPRDLGLHLDAFDAGDDEHREVGGVERGGDVADEVGVARRVEQVHLVRRRLRTVRASSDTEIRRRCSSGSKSETVEPSSTRPRRVVAPARTGAPR